MIETERSRKRFIKDTGRDNLDAGSLEDHMQTEHGLVTFPVSCPICAERRRKKAESMKRFRAKKKGAR